VPVESEQGGSTIALRNKYSWERVSPVGTYNTIGDVLPNGSFSGPGGAGYDPANGRLADSTHRHKLGIRGLNPLVHNNRRYMACVTNDSFPNLTICMKQKKVEVGECRDSSGNPIHCQTMIVQFHPDSLAGKSPQEQEEFKAATAESIGAEPVDKCLCGDLELWAISDTSSAMVEGFGSGTKRSTTSTATKPQLLSADPNYALLEADTTPSSDSLAMQQGEGNTTAKTLVAIIDAGIDYEYTALKPYISEGPSDGDTCMAGAYWGYNFLDENNNASDDHGHGTAVAGIVAGLSQNNTLPDTASTTRDIGILPLKYTDRHGNGSLFHAACAMRYAADYSRVNSNNDTARVRVINNSWGYYGDPCIVLENTIEYVGNECGILVISSAGNDGQSVQGPDSLWHWPSNSIWDPEDTIAPDNILAVAAVSNSSPDVLASYSNFGDVHIDIAAQGTDISTQAGTGNGFGPVEGTSFATAQVSRAAALLFDKYPEATYWAVRYALMHGVDTLQHADSSLIVSQGRMNFERADSILNEIIDRTICGTYYTTTTVDKVDKPTIENLVKVYPNPVAGLLTVDIDYNLTTTETEITVINVQGQSLQQYIIPSGETTVTIPTEQLTNGVYFIHLKTSEGQIVKKILKI